MRRKIISLSILTICALFSSYIFTVVKPSPILSTAFVGLNLALLALLAIAVLFTQADNCRTYIKSVNLAQKNNLSSLGRNKRLGKMLGNSGRNSTARAISWLDIAMKLSRNAYYVHDVVIMWTFARLREPVTYLSMTHVSFPGYAKGI